MELHSHDYVEITCIDHGGALHRINGAEYKVEPGYLVFIRAEDLHSLTPLNHEPLELTNVAIKMPVYRSLLERYPDAIEWVFRNHEQFGYYTLLDASQRHRFNQCVNELFCAKQDQSMAIDRFMLNLMTDLIPHHEDVPLPQDAPEWLTNAWMEIQRPEFFSKGVAAFYRLASRSREHTARALRKHFNLTPSECVLQARMKFAARQLEMSTRSILDISLDCGFSDLAHFYKVFKAHYSTTPRHYRLSHRLT